MYGPSLGHWAYNCTKSFIGMWFGAWALTLIWTWFIVPAFGLPVIGMATAFGIYSVARLLGPSSSYKELNALTSHELNQQGTYEMIRPLVALLFAFIVKVCAGV